MQLETLCFLISEGKIWLGKKKRGFGKNKYNGYGGKFTSEDRVNFGEGEDAIQGAAIREVFEEAGVRAKTLTKKAILHFYFPDSSWNREVHVYEVNSWEGIPQESEEMTSEEFSLDKIPYDQMWDADRRWILLVLEGKKIRGEINFEKDSSGEFIARKYSIEFVGGFS